jgi:hypothetical protein
MPMMWGTSKAIQCFAEEPEFVFGIDRVPNGLAYNGKLIVGEVCLAKGIFAVTLLENTTMLDHQRGKHL